MKDKGEEGSERQRGKWEREEERAMELSGGWEDIGGKWKHPRIFFVKKIRDGFASISMPARFVVVVEIPKWRWERASEKENSSGFVLFRFNSTKWFLLCMGLMFLRFGDFMEFYRVWEQELLREQRWMKFFSPSFFKMVASRRHRGQKVQELLGWFSKNL